jgi:HK97 family phage prohead protease
MPPGLVKYAEPGTLVAFSPERLTVPELSSADDARIERKIMAGTEVKAVATIAAVPVTESGTFTGYLAAYGRDHSGDQIQPGAMDDTAAALNSGAIQWHLTDAHSEKASDVVATVTAAAIDHHGLRIQGQWMPTERAQALRQMVRNGARLGLSIDYLTDASRPDGKGGRLLDRITVVGGAVTPKPMNAAATITEGKSGAWAPVVDIYADAQACHHADPGREAEDRLLAAAGWPPSSWPRDLRLSLIRGAAEAKARREAEGDPERARDQARRDFDNRYSFGLAETMARLRASQR